MSVKIMGLVWDLKIDPRKKFVLLAYADHANHEGSNIWPAIKTIAKKTGYHERSIQRITKELEELGYLVNYGAGPKGTNRWRIPLDKKGDKITPLSNHTQTGDIPSGDKITPDLTINKTSLNEEEGKTTFKDAYTFYDENMGVRVKYDDELLGDMCDEHTAYWVIKAMKIAVKQNARSLAYTDGILKRWKVQGYGSEFKRGNGSTPSVPQGVSAAQEWLKKKQAQA